MARVALASMSSCRGLQREVTCGLPKSRDASGISPVTAAQATGAAVDVSKRSESSADDCAQSGAEISSEVRL